MEHREESDLRLLTAVNLLTEDVVLAAKEEIQTGRSIQLDWPLHNLEFPGFGRRKLEHKVIDLTHSLNNCGFDDEIHVNTQCGSQWDSLKHVSKTCLIRPLLQADVSVVCIPEG